MSNLIVIADRVIHQGETTAVTALPSNDLEALHYIVTDRINAYKRLSSKVMGHIYQYVESLNRYHRGLFWKIFNKFSKAFSERWYLGSRKHTMIVLKSFVCFAKEPVEHWAEIRNLEAVYACPCDSNILMRFV